ncbi:MAG: OmpA family protein [Brachymonas sp.]|nr:OmpA family protein [Brachymonas sp.]
MKAADAFRQGIKDFRINVEFDTGKATLRAASRAELDELAAVLKEAGVAGEVAGHTDNVGQPQANLALSQQRAQAVKDYLVQQGVAADKLSAAGYGMTQPIADNASAEGRQRNRRVQFRVL